jgi:hypothetical protein
MIPQDSQSLALFRSTIVVVATLMFCWFATLDVRAQSATDNGTPLGLTAGSPEGSYALSGFESVNLYNGNLNFSLPALHVGGRGNAGYTLQVPIDQRWESSESVWYDQNGIRFYSFYPVSNSSVPIQYANYSPGSIGVRASKWKEEDWTNQQCDRQSG